MDSSFLSFNSTCLSSWYAVSPPNGSSLKIFLGDTCGVHHEKGECNDSTIRDFESKIKSFQKFYFPPELKQVLSMTEFRTPRKLKPNGGWKDERDIELCKLFQRTTKPEDLELFRLGILKKISNIGK